MKTFKLFGAFALGACLLYPLLNITAASQLPSFCDASSLGLSQQPSVYNLQSIVDAWGREYASRQKTIKDNHTVYGYLRRVYLNGAPDYEDKKISHDIRNTNFSFGNGNGLPEFSHEARVDNGSSLVVPSTFKYTHSIENRLMHTITCGLDIGASLKTKIEIPLLNGEGSISSKANFSNTNQKTASNTKTWEIDKTIPVAPHTTSIDTYIVCQGAYQGDITADVFINGDVVIAYNYSGDNEIVRKPILKAVSIAQVFAQLKEWKIPYDEKRFKIDNQSVVFKASGTFEITQGTKDYLKIQECTYPLPKNEHCPSSKRSYTISLSGLQTRMLSNNKIVQSNNDPCEIIS